MMANVPAWPTSTLKGSVRVGRSTAMPEKVATASPGNRTHRAARRLAVEPCDNHGGGALKGRIGCQLIRRTGVSTEPRNDGAAAPQTANQVGRRSHGQVGTRFG